jgi:hypothetical protein
LAGYPKEFVFTSREALDDYLSGDRITCLLCGRSFKALNTHLLIHETDEAAYKERFGIPWRRGLQSTETMRLRKKAGKKALKKPGRIEHLKKQREAATELRREGTSNARPKVGFLIEEYTERALMLQRKESLFDKAALLNALAQNMTIPEAAKSMGYAPKTVSDNRRRDSAFDEMVARAIEAQPFSVQARGEATGERFEKALRVLFDKGYSDKQAAEKLGVTAMTCNRRTKAWRNAHNARVDGTQPEHLTIDGAKPPVKDAN